MVHIKNMKKQKQTKFTYKKYTALLKVR